MPFPPTSDDVSPTPADAWSSESDPPWFDDEADAGWAHSPTGGGGLPWRSWLSAIRRRFLLVAGMVVLGGAAAVAAWRTMEPEYVAQGSLWIQSSERVQDGQGPIRTAGLLQSYAWVDLLRSFSVLDSVVIRERLYLRPASSTDPTPFAAFGVETEPVPGTYRLTVDEDLRRYELLRGGEVLEHGGVGDSIGTELGFVWRPQADVLTAGGDYRFTVVNPRDAARILSEQMQTSMDQLGTFIRLQMRGTDPRRLASVLNALMDRHVELAAELKRGNLDERTAILEEQLAYVEEELRQAERDLEDFRVRTVTLPSDEGPAIAPGLQLTRDPVFSNFFDLRIRLDQIRRDRERIESVLDVVPDSGIRIQSLELIPAVRSSMEIQDALRELTDLRAEHRALLTRYTPDYPPAQDLAERVRTYEMETVPALLRSLVTEMRRDEGALQEEIAGISSDLSEVPPRTIEEARLTRRVEIAENLHSELRQRFEEARLASASSIPDVRILDRAAAPEVPAGDNRLLMALMLVAGSLGTGLLGAVGLDVLDGRLRYPSDVQKEIGLTILGTVPRIPKRSDVVAAGFRGSENEQQAVEAFRELRMTLQYAYGTAGPLVLAVVSPGEGEGKSLISANLALAFAELGRTTLLVDADVRRGNLHETFGVPRKPGLIDVLRHASPAGDALHSSGFPDLFVIPSGSRLQSAPELVGSETLGRLFSSARKKFDVIIVDTPPLGAGSDAFILSAMAGHAVVVLRSGSTDRSFARAKLSPMERLPVRIMGAILNDFQGTDLYGSYVSGYLSSYAATDEPDPDGTDAPSGGELVHPDDDGESVGADDRKRRRLEGADRDRALEAEDVAEIEAGRPAARGASGSG